MKIFPKKVDTFSLEAIRHCPDVLFNGVNSDIRKKIEFYNEKGQFVGGVSIMIEDFDFFFSSMFFTDLQIPLPKYCMYIETFEVSRKFRHQGYGKLMIEYLEKLRLISLSYNIVTKMMTTEYQKDFGNKWVITIPIMTIII